MKKAIFHTLTATCILIALLAMASCGQESQNVTDAPSTTDAAVLEHESNIHIDPAATESTVGEESPEETWDERDISSMHGIVKSVGEDSLLVYFANCADITKVDESACVRVPMTDVNVLRDGVREDEMWIGLADIKVGDYVFVSGVYEKAAGGPGRYHKVQSVTVCAAIRRQYTVSIDSRWKDCVMLGGCPVNRSFFDRGNAFENGEPITFESLREGDVLEVIYNGEILASMPGQFGHICAIHVVERAVTVPQEAVWSHADIWNVPMKVSYWDGDRGVWLMKENGETLFVEVGSEDADKLRLDGKQVPLSREYLYPGRMVTVEIWEHMTSLGPGENDGRIQAIEIWTSETTTRRGVIHAIESDRILVYFGFDKEAEQITAEDCYAVPLTGVPLLNENKDAPVSSDSLQVGDIVEVCCGGKISVTTPPRYEIIGYVASCAPYVGLKGLVKCFDDTVMLYRGSKEDLDQVIAWDCISVNMDDVTIIDGESGATLQKNALREGDRLVIRCEGDFRILEIAPSVFSGKIIDIICLPGTDH